VNAFYEAAMAAGATDNGQARRAPVLWRLDEVSAVSLGFPHDYFRLEAVRSILTGGLADRIKA
jgi:hypothetical protein